MQRKFYELVTRLGFQTREPSLFLLTRTLFTDPVKFYDSRYYFSWLYSVRVIFGQSPEKHYFFDRKNRTPEPSLFLLKNPNSISLFLYFLENPNPKFFAVNLCFECFHLCNLRMDTSYAYTSHGNNSKIWTFLPKDEYIIHDSHVFMSILRQNIMLIRTKKHYN